jgi:DNA-binding XRE family transcriptional regulator
VNRVQKFRESALMAKAELARKAGVSESTIDRVEAGHDCRMETKRKILFALGLSLHDSGKLFPRLNGATRLRAGGR